VENDVMAWSEQDSEHFIDFGAYFVPDREVQIATICELLPEPGAVRHAVELCCGEGLLTRALLERHPEAIVHAFDGSEVMLAAARVRAGPHAARLRTRRFDLAATDWRGLRFRPDAVVSSLAVHHLDGAGKQALFRDIAAALAPGGVFVLADLVEPAAARGRRVAARAWDDAVRARALELDGGLAAFEQFRADRWNYYGDPNPDPVDLPSSVFEQLRWLEAAGLEGADMHWMQAGHAIMSAAKPA
jgi:tRNA (cmo5U34)-methyltransferase